MECSGRREMARAGFDGGIAKGRLSFECFINKAPVRSSASRPQLKNENGDTTHQARKPFWGTR